jgi:hypothetical protein
MPCIGENTESREQQPITTTDELKEVHEILPERIRIKF